MDYWQIKRLSDNNESKIGVLLCTRQILGNLHQRWELPMRGRGCGVLLLKYLDRTGRERGMNALAFARDELRCANFDFPESPSPTRP